MQANGLRVHALAAGPARRPARRAPARLSRAGALVATSAPRARGGRATGRSRRPARLRRDRAAGPYDVGTLAQRRGRARPGARPRARDVVGHDWGGAVAWTSRARHPDLVQRLVALNCPPASASRRRCEHSPGPAAPAPGTCASSSCPGSPSGAWQRTGRGRRPRARGGSHRPLRLAPRGPRALPRRVCATGQSQGCDRLVPRRVRRDARSAPPGGPPTARLRAYARPLGSRGSVPRTRLLAAQQAGAGAAPGTSRTWCSSRMPATSCRTRRPNGSTRSCCGGWGRP